PRSSNHPPHPSLPTIAAARRLHPHLHPPSIISFTSPPLSNHITLPMDIQPVPIPTTDGDGAVSNVHEARDQMLLDAYNEIRRDVPHDDNLQEPPTPSAATRIKAMIEKMFVAIARGAAKVFGFGKVTATDNQNIARNEVKAITPVVLFAPPIDQQQPDPVTIEDPTPDLPMVVLFPAPEEQNLETSGNEQLELATHENPEPATAGVTDPATDSATDPGTRPSGEVRRDPKVVNEPHRLHPTWTPRLTEIHDDDLPLTILRERIQREASLNRCLSWRHHRPITTGKVTVVKDYSGQLYFCVQADEKVEYVPIRWEPLPVIASPFLIEMKLQLVSMPANSIFDIDIRFRLDLLLTVWVAVRHLRQWCEFVGNAEFCVSIATSGIVLFCLAVKFEGWLLWSNKV
ncbi:hypothetical protein FN846DRAFT_999632, partial [Sphaerosporella brunnea]